MTYTFIAPCHFGLEAVCKKEIQDLGYEVVAVEDGKVTFTGDESAISRANIFIRTAERILLLVKPDGEAAGKYGTDVGGASYSFTAETWDELFEKTKALPWEAYIPADGKFWVTKANSVKSKLFSPSDIQSIMKKAMVERLRAKYRVEWFPETGADFPVRVSILKDRVCVGLDTSGISLHKRGYRKLTAKAPITETLAAALILLTPWHGDRILVDPFCGSGTFCIEAAMLAANIAPGMNREFTAEKWTGLLPKKNWYAAVQEAEDLIKRDIRTDIQGYDIDGEVIKAARENARLAGVESMVHFQKRDVKDLSHPKKYGFIITNPPYGERLEEKSDLPELYKTLGERYRALDSWSMYMITSYEEAEKYIGRKADRNRKIYNGMLKTYFYQFMGPRPPKRPAGTSEPGGNA